MVFGFVTKGARIRYHGRNQLSTAIHSVAQRQAHSSACEDRRAAGGGKGDDRPRMEAISHPARHSYVLVIIHHMFVQAKGIQHRCQERKRGHYEKEIVKSVVSGIP